MDYFGQLVDELTELQERIEASPHAADAKPLLAALHRAMMISLKIERQRTKPIIGEGAECDFLDRAA